MRSVARPALAAFVATALLAPATRAEHATPRRAVSLKAELLTAYENCAFPGEGFSTDPPGLVLPACEPVRSDPVCNFVQGPEFGNQGSGKILAKVLANETTGIDDDIEIKVKLRNLAAGCIGETLTAVASPNATADDCSASPEPGDSCTAAADILENLPVGICVVTPGGRCTIKTTVNTFAGGPVIEPGNRLQLEVRDLRIKRGSLTTFTPGLLIATHEEGPTSGSHETPKIAKALSAKFVTAYDDCGSPYSGFTTDPPGLILPACTPVRSDPACTFQALGRGSLLAKAKRNKTTKIRDDVQVKVALSRLSAGCAGSTLTAVASVNATSGDCSASPAAGGSCTVVDSAIENFAIGTCVVTANGRCSINTRVNVFAGTPVIEAGNRLQLELRDTRIKRGGLTTFTPGLLVE
jgi:hypothetical protein